MDAALEKILNWCRRSAIVASVPRKEFRAQRLHENHGNGLDYSIFEEFLASVVALVVTVSVRGVYGIPPLLLSAAIGLTTAHLCVVAKRVCWREQSDLCAVKLVESGKVMFWGWTFLVVLLAWGVLVAHCGYYQLHLFQARTHLAAVPANQPAFVSEHDSTKLFANLDLQAAKAALFHFQACDRCALIPMSEVKLGLFWTSLALGDQRGAMHFLDEAVQVDPHSEPLREFASESLWMRQFRNIKDASSQH